MKLLLNENIFSYKMTGILSKDRSWFIGFSKNNHNTSKTIVLINDFPSFEIELTCRWYIKNGELILERRVNKLFGYYYEWINESYISEIEGERR